MGKYVSIDFNNLYDENDRVNISNMLITSLKELYKIKQSSKVLIVGLGNSKIIADSLGPNVADKIIVTNHLFKVLPNDIEKDMNKVCVLTPKVMGQTGLDSADIVEAVSNLFKPDLVIVTGDMVLHSKPDPEIYIKACKNIAGFIFLF